MRTSLLPESAKTKKSRSAVHKARPFLKWAGGKQQLLAQYEPYFPAGFARYLEPFVGGGAVFFHLWNTGRLSGQVFLCDSNAELINAYVVVRDRVDEILGLLAIHKERHSREHYYETRNLDRDGGDLSDVERAARTIYLNRTCYNGLYRVNSLGQFNAPLGSYENPGIVYEDALRAASAALKNVGLAVGGFERSLDLAEKGDFVYLDPPYDPISRTASFTAYTANSFRDEDQRRLAGVFSRLSERGCLCMLSNSYTPFIMELYGGFRVEVVRASRAINSDANGRGSVKEVVVLNY